MARKGLNQSQLADLAKVSQATVSFAVQGRPVSAKSAVLIQRALDRQPNVLDALLEKASA